jgi:hypothetical protein
MKSLLCFSLFPLCSKRPLSCDGQGNKRVVRLRQSPTDSDEDQTSPPSFWRTCPPSSWRRDVSHFPSPLEVDGSVLMQQPRSPKHTDPPFRKVPKVRRTPLEDPFGRGYGGFLLATNKIPSVMHFPPFSKGGRGDYDSSSTRNTGIQPFHIA